MAISKDSLQARFKAATKSVFIESIEDKVKVRALTLAESNEVNTIMFANSSQVGKDKQLSLNPSDYAKAALKGVQIGLIEPKMKSSELSELSKDAVDFINEVFNAIQETTKEEDEKSKKN